MTVAATIEIVPGMHPEPGPGQPPAALPQRESFRSNWQSLLASMGTSTDALGEEASGELNGRFAQGSGQSLRLLQPDTQSAARRAESGGSAELSAESSTPSHALETRKSAKTPEPSPEAGVVPSVPLPLPGIVAPAPVSAQPVMSVASRSKDDSDLNVFDRGTDTGSPAFLGSSGNSPQTAHREQGPTMRPSQSSEIQTSEAPDSFPLANRSPDLAGSGFLPSMKPSAMAPGAGKASGAKQASHDAATRILLDDASRGAGTGGAQQTAEAAGLAGWTQGQLIPATMQGSGMAAIQRSRPAPDAESISPASQEQKAGRAAREFSASSPGRPQPQGVSPYRGMTATQPDSSAVNAGEKNAPSSEGISASSQEESLEPVNVPARVQTNVDGPHPASLHGQAPTERQPWAPKLQPATAPAQESVVNPPPANAASAIQQPGNPLGETPLAGRQAVSDGIRAPGRSAPAGTQAANPIPLAERSSPNGYQPGNPAQEMNAPSHGAGGDFVVRDTKVEVAGAALNPAVEPGRDTFAALDGANATGAPAWIHAGAQRAEGGFQDPALGWVGVRADGGAGGVHAAVVPSSADAGQTLGGHMAGLNDYLAEQHLHVTNLTVGAPESRAGEFAQGGSQSNQQQADQGSGQSAGAGAQAGTGSDTAIKLENSTESEGSARVPEPSTPLGGVHISVMA